MPTMPPTPKFRPTLPTLPTPKFYGPASSTPKFQPTPKFYGPTLPTPPTLKLDPRHPRTHASGYPRHPRDLADSLDYNIMLYYRVANYNVLVGKLCLNPIQTRFFLTFHRPGRWGGGDLLDPLPASPEQ